MFGVHIPTRTETSFYKNYSQLSKLMPYQLGLYVHLAHTLRLERRHPLRDYYLFSRQVPYQLGLCVHLVKHLEGRLQSSTNIKFYITTYIIIGATN